MSMVSTDRKNRAGQQGHTVSQVLQQQPRENSGEKKNNTIQTVTLLPWEYCQERTTIEAQRFLLSEGKCGFIKNILKDCKKELEFFHRSSLRKIRCLHYIVTVSYADNAVHSTIGALTSHKQHLPAAIWPFPPGSAEVSRKNYITFIWCVRMFKRRDTL